MNYIVFILLSILFVMCSNDSNIVDSNSSKSSLLVDTNNIWSITISSSTKNDSLLLGDQISFTILLDSINSDSIDSLKIDFNGDGVWESVLPKYLSTFDFYVYRETGTYNIICGVKDSVIWKYDTLSICVYKKQLISNNAPILTLNGSSKIVLQQFGNWEEPGFSVFDAEDGDITDSVEITVIDEDSNSVDLSQITKYVGKYFVVYGVYDSYGEYVSKVREVDILSSNISVPVITLKDSSELIEVDSTSLFSDTLLVIDEKYGEQTAKNLQVKLYDMYGNIVIGDYFILEYNSFMVIVLGNNLLELNNGRYVIEYSVKNSDNVSAEIKTREIVVK